MADVINIRGARVHNLKDISLHSALWWMLDALDLEYVIRHEVLLITTQDRVDERLLTRVYKVADLVAVRNRQGKTEYEHEWLVELITTTLAPSTWSDVGGQGVVAVHEGVLIVSQTDRQHCHRYPVAAA